VEFTNRYSGDVRDALERAGAALHAITIGTFYQTGETVTRERALVLDVVARNSGGQRISLVSATGLESALGRLADELSSQYKVVYGRPQSLIPPETLEVTPARPGVTMRAMPMRRQGA
jgi:hypothetical protein